MAALNLVIISGLSGSGKSHALKAFEDAGYFCVDNLPPALLPTFVELCGQQEGEIKNVALGIDIRERVFFGDLAKVLEELKTQGHALQLVFLEAREEVLVRRFSESRRPHPLLPHMPVLEGVRFERERLSGLRGHADRVIDTSDITVHELRELLARQFRQDSATRRMTISLVTFGYKFGVPYDIDLLFDVRFIRNPFFIPDLKPLTGEDPRVQQYVCADPTASRFLEHLQGLLVFLIPLFERDQRSYLSIGIGCTGGRHRSVTMAMRLQEKLSTLGYEVSVAHRDIKKT
ncbi:RNase adapter RapZ [Nitrospirales bacterium NOB]|nr:MAG: P-loop ATPase protein family protein [Nitrospira sp. OLB3]MBV6469641.1 Nucleotide-binding protein YvcJ [Nitrospirota bacterium]MCE7965517.1 RNase adapter RapZ [Nitrospira sp. NTP2]MCK6493456.1 RNase adapter RapZ [Nitrospira sp.]MDL1888250.1 RNase adapter RapZ [Nitrospirales bacterium NOB]MEB2338764.1 RNase adapter RapZ [Nitrospirales bacterium]